ncbi:hypothetical protein NIES208_11595 [[Limnothrix rosea] IAM M-220]|nr:hypothetical protein NIES208_11595 [[Limnothrix rosea] IAM M-220]
MVNLQEYKTASVTPLKKLLPKNSYGDSTKKYFTDKTYRERWVERNKVYAYGTHYRTGLALTLNQYQLLSRYLKIAEKETLSSFIELALATWLNKL